MPAIERMSQSLGLNIKKLSRDEILIVEIELFARICEELREIYKQKYADYFYLIKFDLEKVNTMFEENFIVDVIKDLLLSKEYSLEGIACYTQTPEEVICDIAAGCINSPSLHLSRRLISLHRNARPNLYREIMKKIIAEYIDKDEKNY
jgi:hypothetical protein